MHFIECFIECAIVTSLLVQFCYLNFKKVKVNTFLVNHSLKIS